MRPESPKYLYDVREAIDKIITFTRGCDLARYTRDEMLRSAVERQLEIIGEALAQLARRDPDAVGRVTEYPRIIAFRNILIHGYAEVDSRLVWAIVTTRLSALRSEVVSLLTEAERG